MFEVIKDFGKREVASEFLRTILIEVATENYRQLMYERMSLKVGALLDPPLRATERVISGLFASAITKVSSRSRTEARIDKKIDPYAEDDESNIGNPGRVDYLAWYRNNTIAIELKSAHVNWSTSQITLKTRARWTKVVEQANTAKEYLKKRSYDDKNSFPSPKSIGLMVLVARSAKGAEFLANEEIVAVKKTIMSEIKQISPTLPGFIATYTFPTEIRDFTKKKKGKVVEGKHSSTPFIIFLGYLAP